MSTKTSTRKIETATAESLVSPPQLDIPFKPIPDDAIPQILSKLFALALEGNTAAAKLLLDILDKRFSDTAAALTAEEALKILQDHCPPSPL